MFESGSTLALEKKGNNLLLSLTFLNQYGEQKIPFGKTKIELVIEPDCSTYFKEISIAINPTNKETEEACKKIRYAYQKGMETEVNKKPEAKTISLARNALNALTRWQGLALLISIFMILSFTGVFSPVVLIASAFGTNLELGALILATFDAILASTLWGSTVALRAITEKTITQVKEFIPEELFVKHVPVTIPTEPPLANPETIDTPRDVEKPSPRLEGPSRGPSPESSPPSTSSSGGEGSGHSSSDDETENPHSILKRKPKTPVVAAIAVESVSGSDSDHNSEDDKTPTPEKNSPRTAGETTAIGAFTASSGAIPPSISTSESEEEEDSEENKNGNSPNNISPAQKRRSGSKSNPSQFTIVDDLLATGDAAAFRQVFKKPKDLQNLDQTQELRTLVLNNSERFPTQSV